MKSILILLFFTFSLSYYSQTITIVSATEQGWAGGVCCATGTNYQINIKVSGAGKKFRLETLWIGQSYFALVETNGYTLVKSERAGDLYFTLNAGFREDRGDYILDLEKEKKVPSTIIQAPKYHGAACIVFTDNKKQKQIMEIQSFKELGFLAYP